MKLRQTWLPLLFFCWARAQGAWEFTTLDEKGADSSGRYVHLAATENESGHRAQLHFAIFDTHKIALRIIDQPNEPRRDLSDVMGNDRYLAGVNGGYFEANYQPVGLLVSGGHVIAPLRKARLLSGILSVADGRVRLQRTAEFSMTKKISEAVQCGPFLVDHARPVAGLDDSRDARRTFVAIGKGNAIALGYSTSLSLAQLAQVLSAGKIASDFTIERALNFDGGSSSAFWFGSDPAVSISEQKTVRDFVAVVNR